MSRFAVYVLAIGLLPGCGDGGNGQRKPETGSVGVDANGDAAPTIAVPAQPEMSRISVGFRAQLDPAFSRGTLAIGAPAPPLTQLSWVRGEPLTEFSSGQVYVVEFWATWCKPCLQSMPHLAELQKRYGTQVRVIGVTDEPAESLEAFLREKTWESENSWGDLLTFSLAIDSTRQLNRDWMEASGQQGIPCSFIIGKSGTIEWIGHPMAIDDPLQAIVAGAWDIGKAREAMIAGQKMKTALDRGDLETAIQSAVSLTTLFPGSFDHAMTRLELLIRANRLADANAAAVTTLAICRSNPEALNSLAWLMATGTDSTEIDLKVAHEAASLANTLREGRDSNILDTLARVTARMGDLISAIELQKKAIDQEPNESQAELVATLEEYESALKKTDAATSDSAPASSLPPEKSVQPEAESEKESARDAEPRAR